MTCCLKHPLWPCVKQRPTLLFWVPKAAMYPFCIPGVKTSVIIRIYHMLVPAGGMDPDGMQWIPSSKKFFVPVKALSKIFRGVFMDLLKKSLRQVQLRVPDGEQSLYTDFAGLKARAYFNNWNVYIKKTFGGANQVVAYLGRYTHRVAISNNRILSMNEQQISFRWKDYRDNQTKVMNLESLCFIRRFLQHILPCGFYKIRYYGIFASVNSNTKMKQCFALLGFAAPDPEFKTFSAGEFLLITGSGHCLCPACGQGMMQWKMLLPAAPD